MATKNWLFIYRRILEYARHTLNEIILLISMSVVHTKQKLDATSLAIESEFDFCLPEFRWPTGTVEPDAQKRIPLRYEFLYYKIWFKQVQQFC